MRALLLFTLASLTTVLSAAATVAPDVEVLRPAPGEVLTAGGEAVVAWRPRGALDPRIVEWEAFLSFNGGEYFAVRVTPHLDVSHQRFVFKVPDVPTDDARILLRFGDEEREVGVDVPHRFAIRPAPFAVAAASSPARGQARGEAARPGEPGVVAWVEGSRDGSDLDYVAAAPLAPDAVPVIEAGWGERTAALADRLAEGTVHRAGTVAPSPRPPPVPRVDRSSLPPTSILLLNCRQNE